MDKEYVVCVHNGTPLSIKKKEMTFATWMGLEVITLREISQRRRK
jgi:hypothetical protein